MAVNIHDKFKQKFSGPYSQKWFGHQRVCSGLKVVSVLDTECSFCQFQNAVVFLQLYLALFISVEGVNDVLVALYVFSMFITELCKVYVVFMSHLYRVVKQKYF